MFRSRTPERGTSEERAPVRSGTLGSQLPRSPGLPCPFQASAHSLQGGLFFEGVEHLLLPHLNLATWLSACYNYCHPHVITTQLRLGKGEQPAPGTQCGAAEPGCMPRDVSSEATILCFSLFFGALPLLPGDPHSFPHPQSLTRLRRVLGVHKLLFSAALSSVLFPQSVPSPLPGHFSASPCQKPRRCLFCVLFSH